MVRQSPDAPGVPSDALKHSRLFRWFRRKARLGLLVAAITAATSVLGASTEPVDLSQVPPAAQKQIDFDQDIRPILEKNCFKCHGIEQPKSHFSLLSREGALKGGNDNKDDVIPGDGLHSHLVHYIAGLVPDMQMPPEGKGEPLTPEQVGLMRAWIDQGVKWSATNLPPQAPVAAAPTPSATATNLQNTNLPSAAKKEIDFDQDIHPILAQNCYRCHGTERPKSHFSLLTREGALKGGDKNTDDVIPGDSVHSHLVQYVSGLVPDMQMPPEGKGEPLTPAQISLLRAWIDQGAKWSTTNAYPQTAASTALTFGAFDVHGNLTKFHEIEGVDNGWAGGVEEFSMESKSSPDTKTTVEGHALFPYQDFTLKLTTTKTDVGFISGGVQQWRKYYSDTGGYYPLFTPPSFSLDENLYLTIGRAWIDFGLTLPRVPQIVVGYEYDYKDGAKSMLEWAGVTGAGLPNKHIYPASKSINEQIHIIKLDVNYEVCGWSLEDKARVEFYSDNTVDQQITTYTIGSGVGAYINTREDYSHLQGANTFRFEKQLEPWWLASGGYLYSQLDGDSSLNQSTVNAMDVPVAGNFWRDQVTLKRQMQAFSLASMFQPVSCLSASVGVQTEFSREEGFGNIDLDTGDPSVPNLFVLAPAVVQSDLDETRTAETLNIRYTRIPYTVLLADGTFHQDSIGQFEEEAGNTPDVFLRDTDYFNSTLDYRAGFSSSPWKWTSFDAHYRRTDSNSDYNHLLDESLQSGLGYSAFITQRDITSDEVLARLVLHPAVWLKTTMSYQWKQSDFTTATDPVVTSSLGDITPGGALQAGYYRAQTWGLGATLIPAKRFYFSGTFNYSTSRTVTAQNDLPAVVPYEGNVYGFIASANYALNVCTAFKLSYLYSKADYGQNNLSGLPLGLDYTQNGLSVALTRKLSERISSSLRYSFYKYSEPSTGGFNNFTANGIFATLIVRWP
jgi:hypothetical protein